MKNLPPQFPVFFNAIMDRMAMLLGIPREKLPVKETGQVCPLVFASGRLVKMSKDGIPIAVTERIDFLPALEKGEYWKPVDDKTWLQYRLSLPLI